MSYIMGVSVACLGMEDLQPLDELLEGARKGCRIPPGRFSVTPYLACEKHLGRVWVVVGYTWHRFMHGVVSDRTETCILGWGKNYEAALNRAWGRLPTLKFYGHPR